MAAIRGQHGPPPVTNDRGHHHSAPRQSTEATDRPDAQVPVDKLAFDLAPNHQEENRHQPVIDPVMKIPWADALAEQTEY